MKPFYKNIVTIAIFLTVMLTIVGTVSASSSTLDPLSSDSVTANDASSGPTAGYTSSTVTADESTSSTVTADDASNEISSSLGKTFLIGGDVWNGTRIQPDIGIDPVQSRPVTNFTF